MKIEELSHLPDLGEGCSGMDDNTKIAEIANFTVKDNNTEINYKEVAVVGTFYDGCLSGHYGHDMYLLYCTPNDEDVKDISVSRRGHLILPIDTIVKYSSI